MNNSIFNPNAFQDYLLSKVQFDAKRVVEVVKSISRNSLDVIRICGYLSGYLDIPEIPETSTVAKAATFKSYDVARDRVTYSCHTEQIVYAKDAAEAQELTGKVFDAYYKIPDKNLRRADALNGISVTCYYKENATCSLKEWLENQ